MDIFSRYCQAWIDKDWDAAVALWSDDIVHHLPGRHYFAGTFQGKQAFIDHLERGFETLGGTMEVVAMHDFLTTADHAVVLVTERAIRGDRTLDFNRIVVYHAANDRITETWSYDFDPYALDEFWK